MKFYARFVVQPLLLLPHEYCYCSGSKSGNIEKRMELSWAKWSVVDWSRFELARRSRLLHMAAMIIWPELACPKLTCTSSAVDLAPSTNQTSIRSIDRSIAPSMFLCLWVSFSPSFTIDRRSFANPSHKMCNFQLLNHQWGKRKIERKKSQNVTYRNQANTIDWLSNGLSAPRLWFWRLLIITAVCCARKFVV